MTTKLNGQSYSRPDILGKAATAVCPRARTGAYLKRREASDQSRASAGKLVFGLMITLLVCCCLVAGAGWLTTRWKADGLQTSNAALRAHMASQAREYAQTVAGLNAQLADTQAHLVGAGGTIYAAHASIADLGAKLSAAQQWQDFWWQRAHPQQFNSFDGLNAWLAKDDTDKTACVFGAACLATYDCDDYATALVHNALEDGYLFSTQIVGDHMMNSTIIGNDIYLIEPQTDEVTLWGHRD